MSEIKLTDQMEANDILKYNLTMDDSIAALDNARNKLAGAESVAPPGEKAEIADRKIYASNKYTLSIEKKEAFNANEEKARRPTQQETDVIKEALTTLQAQTNANASWRQVAALAKEVAETVPKFHPDQ